MSSGPRTYQGCIALSRPLARDLGLGTNFGNYAFGSVVILEGTGSWDGEYVFMDLMPTQWTHYRVDIWFPSLHECRVFGIKRCQIRVKIKKERPMKR